MKKLIYILLAASTVALAATSCKKEEKKDVINAVTVSLTNDGAAVNEADLTVEIKSSDNTITYKEVTDAAGTAGFQLKAGIYTASTSFKKAEDGILKVYNGTAQITVEDNKENKFQLALTSSTTSQVIIKEIYYGGCLKNDETTTFGNDCYLTLYNNTSEEADISKLGFAVIDPSNSQARNNYTTNGVLLYEADGWIPAATSCWWFQTEVKIPAFSQIVVAIFGAIDHTTTYTHSVNLSHADYVMYNKNVYKHSKYVAPDASIPTNHYLNTFKYGMGTAWMLSNSSPGVFIFIPEETTVEAFTAQAAGNYYGGDFGSFNCVCKIPAKWITDGVEIFNAPSQATNENTKRFTNAIDAGYVLGTNKKGYSIYRNVDKEATEAIEGNYGKIVYNYAGGTADIETGSTDPSGIDAEASIAKGAKIVYKDTNNSTNDFHQRLHPAIKK